METSMESINARVVVMGNALGQARAYEQQLEDERPLLKEMAIIRIMARDKINSTPAEKIVESDLEYMEHRVKQRTAIVGRFKADAEYQVAKAALTRASLMTPATAELEQKLKSSKREADLKEIDLRRIRGYLRDRINDVDRLSESLLKLTAVNRELAARHDVAPFEVPPSKDLVDTLDDSRAPVEATA